MKSKQRSNLNQASLLPVRVLIVQLGRIGDTVLTTPMFKTIAENIPGAEIYVLVSRHGFDVLFGNPRLAGIYVYKKDPFSILSLFLKLWMKGFDWWIDPKDHYSGESSIIARICCAKQKIGYNRGHKKKVFSYGIRSFEENSDLHVVERNLNCLKPLNIHLPRDLRPELFPDAGIDFSEQFIKTPNGCRRVLVNISAGSESRQLQEEKWGYVIKACEKRNYATYLNYKPSDRPVAMHLKELYPSVHIFHTSTIREVIALMPSMDLVITPDTSIVHIASAFNIPQIALFSNFDHNLPKFRPLSDQSIVVQPNSGDDFQDIESDAIIEALERMEIYANSVSPAGAGKVS